VPGKSHRFRSVFLDIGLTALPLAPLLADSSFQAISQQRAADPFEPDSDASLSLSAAPLLLMEDDPATYDWLDHQWTVPVQASVNQVVTSR